MFKCRKNKNKKYTYPDYARSFHLISLGSNLLMSCLKQFTLAAVLRLLGSLFKVLDPKYDKLCIPNFDLLKGNFNFCYNSALVLHYRQQDRKLR